MREQDTGQREARGGLFLLFIYTYIYIYIYIYCIYKATMYKQRAYIFALEYTEQVGNMKIYIYIYIYIYIQYIYILNIKGG